MLQIIGAITPPPAITSYGSLAGNPGGLIKFFSNILRVIIIIGGLWAFFNLITAGYDFLSAAGDPKRFEKAWAKIWQSMLGLLIMLVSFILAAVFGQLLFGDPTVILNPKIYGP